MTFEGLLPHVTDCLVQDWQTEQQQHDSASCNTSKHKHSARPRPCQGFCKGPSSRMPVLALSMQVLERVQMLSSACRLHCG